MTSNFFKIVILNSLLLRFSASFDQSLNVSGNDVKAAVTSDMVGLSSGGRHKWLAAAVMGDRADAKDFPFLASIVLDDDLLHVDSSCGGTIVSRWHLLTSAKCICDLKGVCPKLNANLLYVIVGSNYRWNPQKDAVHHTIEEIIMHPEFFKNNFNNLAMIQIKGAFSLNNKVQIIKLPDLNMKENIIWMENSGAQCTIFGWNTMSAVYITGMFKNKYVQLNYCKVNLKTFKSCLDSWGNSEYLKFPYNVCAQGSRIINYDYCTGDKGSSLICGTGDYRYILGVASMTHDCVNGCFRTETIEIKNTEYSKKFYFEIGCPNDGKPIIFTRVDNNLEFIKKTIDSYDEKTKSAKSSGYFIHSQSMTKYYCTSLTSVLILTLRKKIKF